MFPTCPLPRTNALLFSFVVVGSCTRSTTRPSPSPLFLEQNVRVQVGPFSFRPARRRFGERFSCADPRRLETRGDETRRDEQDRQVQVHGVVARVVGRRCALTRGCTRLRWCVLATSVGREPECRRLDDFRSRRVGSARPRHGRGFFCRAQASGQGERTVERGSTISEDAIFESWSPGDEFARRRDDVRASYALLGCFFFFRRFEPRLHTNNSKNLFCTDNSRNSCSI